MDRDAYPAFRLHRGVVALRQSTPTTCGSAALVVARMMADPQFAEWVRSGAARRPPAPGLDGLATAGERFAAYEQVVRDRTARALPGSSWRLIPQLPWPKFWGTAPWAALRELASATGSSLWSYRIVRLRGRSRDERVAVQAQLEKRVSTRRPALLYTGNALLPRHVTLLVPDDDGGSGLDVYEPSSGTVSSLPPDSLATDHLAGAGWPVPWLVVAPGR